MRGSRLLGHARYFAVTAATVALPLGVAALAVLLLGHDPARVAAALVRGSVGTPSGLEATLKGAIALVLCGLAVTLGFRAGAFNLGAEGQLVAGAVGATAAGTALGACSPWLATPLVLGAGALGGAAWAAVAAWLKVRRGAPEVLATILLNLVAVQVARFLISYGNPLNETAGSYLQSDPIAPAARIEPWTLRGVEVPPAIFLALVLSVAVDLVLARTRPGLELRVSGANPDVARATGFSPARATWTAFLAGGALAGLAGAIGIASFTHRLYGSVAEGAGYSAVAVALVARLRPHAVVLAALSFAALEAGAQAAQRQAAVPKALASAVEGLVVLAVLARGALATRVAERAARREPSS